MRVPVNLKTSADLRQAVKILSVGDAAPAFQKFMEWIESELKARDAENRIPGYENKTSEAGALSVICEYVAACQRPEPTATENEEDAEGESAGPCM